MNKTYLQNEKKIFEKFRELKIIPVVKAEDINQAEQIAERLLSQNLPVAEITYRTQNAGDCIKHISKKYPDMLIGAGTVTDVKTARDAIKNGASFIVMPGFDKKTVLYCIKKGVPVVPGVATPTEVMKAISCGISVLKLFPAEVLGGIKFIKALVGPFSKVKFIPTGGITKENADDYLSLSNVLAVGGTWVVK